jgi:hypothetical protein
VRRQLDGCQPFREAVAIEADHVGWGAAYGPDEVANALALCSLHHKLFDQGAIGMTPDHTVAVSSHFIERSPAADSLVQSLVEQPVLDPQAGQSRTACRPSRLARERGHPGPGTGGGKLSDDAFHGSSRLSGGLPEAFVRTQPT